MSVSLGLSIGVANLVAARADGTPMRRASVLRLFEHRAAEVGLPEENPGVTEPGLVLRGFVERVGDPAPLVAADGTRHQGEALTVEALNAMARTVGYGAPITVAAPAYWSEGQFAALRGALRSQPALAPDGVPAAVISDATASLAALHARPGCPTSGVVALCDFGAGGTSVTLAGRFESPPDRPDGSVPRVLRRRNRPACPGPPAQSGPRCRRHGGVGHRHQHGVGDASPRRMPGRQRATVGLDDGNHCHRRRRGGSAVAQRF